MYGRTVRAAVLGLVATAGFAADVGGAATVTVGVRQGTATEEGAGTAAKAGFTLHRDGGNPALALTVTVSFGGTAISGQDYHPVATSVTIPAGETTVTVVISSIDDNAPEGIETVVLKVEPGAGYVAGAPAAQTVAIADNDGAGGVGDSH